MIKIKNRIDNEWVEIHDDWYEIKSNTIKLTLPKNCSCNDGKCISKRLIKDFDRIDANNWAIHNGHSFCINYKKAIPPKGFSCDFFMLRTESLGYDVISYTFVLSNYTGPIKINLQEKRNILIDEILSFSLSL